VRKKKSPPTFAVKTGHEYDVKRVLPLVLELSERTAYDCSLFFSHRQKAKQEKK